jgi:acetyl-CoA carboxylase biotin carboxyl carrier protein
LTGKNSGATLPTNSEREKAESNFGCCFFCLIRQILESERSVSIKPGSISVDLKDIKAIIDLMKKNSISEFEMEKQDFKIKLKRGGNGGMHAPMEESQLPSYPMPQISAGTQMMPVSLPTAPSNELEIRSPMVGTFYRAPSPESANYVDIGSEVNSDTVVCIIEAMKVMNEIKAEVRGVITQILVESAKPVEFGQPLFKIRPL